MYRSFNGGLPFQEYDKSLEEQGKKSKEDSVLVTQRGDFINNA